MSLPLHEIILDGTSSEGRWCRGIETRYHLLMMAQTALDVRDFERMRLAALHRASVQAAPASTPANISGFYPYDPVAQLLEDLRSEPEEVPLAEDYTISEKWINPVSDLIIQQRDELLRVEDELARTLSFELAGMRRLGIETMYEGMMAPSESREVLYRDALDRFEKVIADPAGAQDYAVWFRMGWLEWKLGNIPEALAYFTQASRLSAEKGDIYYTESLQHLAYMRYLEGYYASAYEAGLVAPRYGLHPTVILDSARYAAAFHRDRDALSLIQQCINAYPPSILYVDADPLLQPIAADYITRMLSEVCERTRVAIDKWRNALEITDACFIVGHCTSSIPYPYSHGGLIEAEAWLREGDYLRILDTYATAASAPRSVVMLAEQALRDEIKTRKAIAKGADDRVEEVTTEAWKRRQKIENRRWIEKRVAEDEQDAYGCFLLLVAGLLFLGVLSLYRYIDEAVYRTLLQGGISDPAGLAQVLSIVAVGTCWLVFSQGFRVGWRVVRERATRRIRQAEMACAEALGLTKHEMMEKWRQLKGTAESALRRQEAAESALVILEAQTKQIISDSS